VPQPFFSKPSLVLDEIQHRYYVNFATVVLEAPGEWRFRLRWPAS
jgi:hypothetical protein